MKRLIGFLLVIFAVSSSHAALTNVERAEFRYPNALAEANPGFESGKAQWTCTSGTFSIDTAAVNQFVPGSKAYANWDAPLAGAGTQCFSKAVKVPKAGNCEATLTVKNGTGLGTHLLVANDGTNDLLTRTIDTRVEALEQRLIFPCPTNGTARVGLRAVASNEPAIGFDQAFIGRSTGVVNAAFATPWVSFTPTTTGLGTLGGATVQWRRTADSMEIAGNIAVGITNGTDATMALPDGRSANTAGWGAKARRVGSWIRDISSASSRKTGSIVIFQASPTLLYFTDDDFTTGRNPFTAIAGSTFLASSDTISVTIDSPIPIVGWTASDAVTADQQRVPNIIRITTGSGTYVPSPGVTYIRVRGSGGGGAGGTDSTGGYGGNTSFGSFTFLGGGGGHAGGLSGQPQCTGGSLPAGFTLLSSSCGAVGGSGATSCGGQGGSSSMAAGGQARCANQGYGGYSGGGGGGGGTSSASLYGGGGGASGGVAEIQGPPAVSGYSYSIGAGGVPVAPGVSYYVAGGGGPGALEITEYFGATTALLANSVSTSVANGSRIIWASVKSVCSSNPCSIGSQSGDFTSITRSGTGVYQANFNAGTFSGTPVCTCSTVGSLDGHCSAYNSTTSSSIVRTYTPAGAAQDGYIEMTCTGAR